MLIGLGVVIYMITSSIDKAALDRIKWSPHTLGWLLAAILFLLTRHFLYSVRLYLLADKKITIWKCIKLVVIWEFGTAITPTALGGSAVFVFVLANEKLGTTRSLAAVLYSIILNTCFFIFSITFLLLIFGFNVIHPSFHSFNDNSQIGHTFLILFTVITTYGLLFAFGLFVSPVQFKKLLMLITSIPFLKKYRDGAIKMGDEMITASNEIKSWPVSYHLKLFGLTLLAWACRFLIVNCLLIALVTNANYHFYDQFKIFGRQVIMFIFMMFSPTPGASGFAEVFFGNFIGDYIPKSAAVIIALIWRFLTYYAYLIFGVIVLPQWLAGVMKKRREDRVI